MESALQEANMQKATGAQETMESSFENVEEFAS